MSVLYQIIGSLSSGGVRAGSEWWWRFFHSIGT